jgi:hypothetical protein
MAPQEGAFKEDEQVRKKDANTVLVGVFKRSKNQCNYASVYA